MKPARQECLIVGSGALATFFAARLSASGVQVTMLCTWPQALEAFHQHGVRVDGESGFNVHATDNPADCRVAQFALVLVKAWQTERAALQLADCLAADGLAVTLQNGLGNQEVLAELLGPHRVCLGVTTIGATLLAPGLVRLGGVGTLTLELNSRLAPLEGMLRIAGFDVNPVEDVQPHVWGKLVINAAINPLTALLRVKNGELLERPFIRPVLLDLAYEAAAVADSLGVRLPFADPKNAVEEVARRTGENISSMYQDILRGAPTEVDVINGVVVRLGKLQGIPTPVNRVILALIKDLSVHGKI